METCIKEAQKYKEKLLSESDLEEQVLNESGKMFVDDSDPMEVDEWREANGPLSSVYDKDLTSELKYLSILDVRVNLPSYSTCLIALPSSAYASVPPVDQKHGRVAVVSLNSVGVTVLNQRLFEAMFDTVGECMSVIEDDLRSAKNIAKGAGIDPEAVGYIVSVLM